MHLSQGLNAFGELVGQVQQLAQVIQSHPALAQAGAASLAATVRNLHQVEITFQRDLANLLQRPLPAPREDAVGAWVGQVKRLSLPDPRLPESLESLQRARKLAEDVARLSKWVQSSLQAAPPPAPAAGSTAGAGVAAATAVTAAAGSPGKILGICMMVASTLGTLGTAYAAHRSEKRRKQTFGGDVDEITPDEAEEQAQTLLNSEIPGAQVRVNRTPDGAFVASVKKGSETLAREEASDPASAASGAAKAAMARDATRTAFLDDEDVIDVTPPRKSAGWRK